LGFLRDETVTELKGPEGNYHALDESERKTIRRMAVERFLKEEPNWLHVWETSLSDLSEDQREMVRPFTVDLISSRMTTIWQNNKASYKKKLIEDQFKDVENVGRKRQRTEALKKSCEECNVELQIKWICPLCEVGQPKDQIAVFPL